MRDAKHFLSEKAVRFFSILRPGRRARLFARIAEIDPATHQQIQINWAKFCQTKAGAHRARSTGLRRLALQTREKKGASFVAKAEKEIQKDMIAIAEKHYEILGATQFRFIQADGILDIVATLRACGYTADEIAKRIAVDRQIIDQVTPEQINKKRRQFGDAILMAADQRVYKDLIAGDVSVETERADRIAGRRRKILIDAVRAAKHGINDPTRQLTPAEVEEKQKTYKDRFGVIDIEEEKK
jgi:leucyl aminopeptidase